MSGIEIERLMTFLEESGNRSRDEIVRWVEEHREQILADLERTGESVIDAPDGEKIVLRKAA